LKTNNFSFETNLHFNATPGMTHETYLALFSKVTLSGNRFYTFSAIDLICFSPSQAHLLL